MQRGDAFSGIEATISGEDSGLKLFNIIRRLAPNLSKSEVRDLFIEGAVSINATSVRGHVDEARRTKIGDVICVHAPRILKACQFDVLFSSSTMVALRKYSGVSMASESEFTKYAFSLLGDTGGSDMEVDWVYRLDRAVAGVCLAAKGEAITLLRVQLARNFLNLSFRAVVCGTVSSRELRCDDEPGMMLQVDVRSVQKCRAVETLSVIDFSPQFSSSEPKNGGTNGLV